MKYKTIPQIGKEECGAASQAIKKKEVFDEIAYPCMTQL